MPAHLLSWRTRASGMQCRPTPALGDLQVWGFCMLSATLSTLEQLAFQPWVGYPWKLWDVVAAASDAAARAVAVDIVIAFREPPCMFDDFSRKFLTRFNTAEALATTGRVVLHGLSFCLRWEITRIECRNAAIKRALRVKSSTHRGDVMDISSDFVLLRSRLLNWVLPKKKQ